MKKIHRNSSQLMDIQFGFAGHPFGVNGVCETFRGFIRSFSYANRPFTIRNIYGGKCLDPAYTLYETQLARNLSSDINLFVINGDEVEPCLQLLQQEEGDSFETDAYNIILPFWELPNYPQVWARQLERFDEIWATSEFLTRSLRAAVERPVVLMAHPLEVRLATFLGRRYFNLPESAYLYLFFFDYTSWIARKNPWAIFEAYQRLVQKHPYGDCCLVVKCNNSDRFPEQRDRLKQAISAFGHRALLIEAMLNDTEVKNLVRCCDCFVSLHRSEGFGRGLAEAMYLGKPVIGTAYSGNVDFMTPENSYPVDYRMIDVGEGEYPHGKGQVWAEPDVKQAARHMEDLFENPQKGREVGARASRDIRRKYSFLSVANKMIERFDQILHLTH